MKTFDKEQCELTEPERTKTYTIKCWEGEGQFYMEAERAFRLEVQNNTFTNPMPVCWSPPLNHSSPVSRNDPWGVIWFNEHLAQVALIRISQVMHGMSRNISARIQMIGSGICQTMDSVIIRIIDKRYWTSSTTPYWNKQRRRLTDLRMSLNMEDAPYSEIFIPPPESTGVRWTYLYS